MEVSSKNTTSIGGNNDNQSFANANIMVKGSYQYDQSANPTPKQLNICTSNDCYEPTSERLPRTKRPPNTDRTADDASKETTMN
jgi:hypothetical protein